MKSYLRFDQKYLLNMFIFFVLSFFTTKTSLASFLDERTPQDCQLYLIAEDKQTYEAWDPTVADRAVSDLVTSIFSPKRLKVEDSVRNLVQRFHDGAKLSTDEHVYILRYYLNKISITAEEAQIGLQLAQSVYGSEFHLEIIYESLVLFNLRIYDLRSGDYFTAFENAKEISDEFLELYPMNELARSLQSAVNRRNSFKAKI